VWDLRERMAPQTLTVSQLRDSVLKARRADFVIDSLRKTGTFTEPMLLLLRRFANGEARFGGGGGGNRGEQIARLGPGGSWNARPGEGAVIGARRGADSTHRADSTHVAAAGAGEPTLHDLSSLFPDGFEQVRDLFQPPGVKYTLANPNAFFGGRQAPVAPTGDYLVTLKAGSEVQRQVLRVEHVHDAPTAITNQQ
jgi:hypothetical protein